MAAANSERFIVRAELRADNETVISYGFDLTASSVFVVTEWNAPIGTSVGLRLTIPLGHHEHRVECSDRDQRGAPAVVPDHPRADRRRGPDRRHPGRRRA